MSIVLHPFNRESIQVSSAIDCLFFSDLNARRQFGCSFSKPKEVCNGNKIFLGAAGSGKTTKGVIPSVCKGIQNGDTVTLFSTEDITKILLDEMGYFSRPYVHFNTNSLNSPRINLFAANKETVIKSFSIAFKEVISDTKQSQDDFFKTLNLQFIKYSIELFNKIYGVRGALRDYYKFIQNESSFGNKILEEYKTIFINKDKHMIAFFEDYFAPHSKTFEFCVGYRSMIKNMLDDEIVSELLHPKYEENTFSLYDHVNGGGIGLFTINHRQRFLAIILMEQIKSFIFNNECLKHHRFIVDECGALMNSGIVELYRRGKAKGVSVAISLQSLTQLDDYDKEVIRDLLLNSNEIHVFDHRFYSREIRSLLNKLLTLDCY